MKDQFWNVTGVHEGRQLSDLPITYLLWFVGSPVMRRVRWLQCKIALGEIRRRLINGTTPVEDDLIAGLRPRPLQERLAMKIRRQEYIQKKVTRIFK